ncbi:DUF3137 domain-containing protein [Flexithrix dorotheae]|uniref:DUF3137 domain-containing protein n=1 Tax=Flexithrix dorotheae TaxID=70993 RepID=UPI00037E3501|nr:DUF3137 domain-containing protein [Flexithrix dorotheae]
MHSEIKKLYQQLLPSLEELETERQGVFKKLELLKKICLGVSLALGVIAFSTGHIMLMIFIWALGITAYTVLYFRFKKSYSSQYKGQVLKKVIARLGNNYGYFPERKIEDEALKESGLFPEFNTTKGEDLITGQFENYAFQMAEMGLWMRKGSGRADHGGTLSYIFKGLVFVGEISLNFPVKIWIISKNAPIVSSNDRGQSDWKRVAVFHKSFNKEYQVFSTDSQIAKKLLPAHILSTIIQVKEEIAEEKMRMELSFQGNKIYLSISTSKELFEPPLKTPVTDFDNFYANFKYLVNTTGLLQKLTLVKNEEE